MVQKSRLVNLIQRGSDEILRFAAVLTEQERRTTGTQDHWSARDVLGHIGVWQQQMVKDLEAVRKGETPPDFFDIDATNAMIFEENAKRSWEEILSLVSCAQQELYKIVRNLTEEELDDASTSWLYGRPLWRRIAVTCFVHPMSHLGPAYIERGNREYANQLREQEASLAAALDDSSAWQGIVHYNLACHYALMGEKRKALNKLEMGFQNNPDLIEYAQEDRDLILLHADPGFAALISRLKAVV